MNLGAVCSIDGVTLHKPLINVDLVDIRLSLCHSSSVNEKHDFRERNRLGEVFDSSRRKKERKENKLTHVKENISQRTFALI